MTNYAVLKIKLTATSTEGISKNIFYENDKAPGVIFFVICRLEWRLTLQRNPKINDFLAHVSFRHCKKQRG